MVQLESATECVSLSFYVKGASLLKNGNFAQKEQGSQVDNEAQGMDAKSGQMLLETPAPLPPATEVSRPSAFESPVDRLWRAGALQTALLVLPVAVRCGAARRAGNWRT